MKKVALLILATVLSTVIYAQESTNDQVIRHLTRAEMAYEMKNYQDAILEYETVIKLKPDYADAYYNLALICEQMQDDHYLQQAIAYYRTYIALVPAEKETITDKIYKLEYLAEKKIEDKEHFESMLGTWKTTTSDKKTGQPDCIVDITSFEGALRIELLPKSKIYTKDLVNMIARVENYKGSLYFSYTDDKTYVPNPAKWDALATTAGLIGMGLSGVSALGDMAEITGRAVAEGGRVGASAGSHADKVKTTLQFYDFKIYEFGKDSLKGYLNCVIEENSKKVLYDKVTYITFVRASEDDNKPAPKRVMTTIGVHGVFTPERQSGAVDYKGDYYPDGGKYKYQGVSLNTELLFISKRSLNKNTKFGFSMNLDVQLLFEHWQGTVYYYGYDVDCWHRGALGIRYVVGLSGVSKISNRMYVNWGVHPIGCHFWSVDYYYAFNEIAGLAGSADLGIGWEVSKKCIIAPNIKFAYYYNFTEVFSMLFEPGISFKFFNYGKNSN